MNDKYNEIDSISDDVLHLGNGLYLRMVVKLGKKDKEGSRDYFHKEYRYNSKYIDQKNSISIKRSFDYFLLIEKKKYRDDDMDCYIQIRPNNMIILNSAISKCVPWLFDKNLFKIRNNKLELTTRVEVVKVYGLPLESWIGFEPIPIYNESNDSYDKGIRIYLSSDDKYIDISGSNFLGLVYTLNSFDMYSTAINLLNYIQRPEIGINLISFETNNNFNSEFEDGVYSKAEGRTIKKAVSKSFFDRVDEL